MKQCLMTEFSMRNNKFTAKVCCLCDRMIKHNDGKWIDVNKFQNDNVIKRFTEVQKQNPYKFNPNARNNPITSLNRIYTQKSTKIMNINSSIDLIYPLNCMVDQLKGTVKSCRDQPKK